MSVFNKVQPSITTNNALREPQIGSYEAVHAHYAATGTQRETGIVLPVGCGKSLVAAILPFAVRSTRTLVIAPGVKIAEQLYEDLLPHDKEVHVYRKFGILARAPFPEPAEIRGTTANVGDLNVAEIVVTNIQQLQGEHNRWIDVLPSDFFDTIIFDEGHHTTADSYLAIKSHFKDARIINLSATPHRADGDLMPGKIIYAYSVADAIAEGFVKQLRALVLNPRTLRYVRKADGTEVTVSSEEVRKLGESDADFRRSIVSSDETLNTIVDLSINELNRIRKENNDTKHKIIACALNYAHCIQITEAYKARRMRAAYVHSKEDGNANRKAFEALDQHELDVIVQVRKLGEGFNHPYLTVAAVFSIFAELSPFIQFVGRIMRTIVPNTPGHPKNRGTVVYHAGANVAKRWKDFQDFAEADKEYFGTLLPEIEMAETESIRVVEPSARAPVTIDVTGQDGVEVQEVPLLEQNPAALELLNRLKDMGYSPEDILRVWEHEPVATTALGRRQAARKALDDLARTKAGELCKKHNISAVGKQLDKKRLGRENWVVVKAALDKGMERAARVEGKPRSDWEQSELDTAKQALLTTVMGEVEKELFIG